MRDLNVLKERIEYAERHLKASHSARERESDALMTMWSQIRDRFEDQEAEIARYRSELADLTQTNDELSQLVDRLIGTIEGSIESSSEETVPKIATLADDLLKSEPELSPLPPMEMTEDPAVNAEFESRSEIEPSVDSEPDSNDGDQSFEEILGHQLTAPEPGKYEDAAASTTEIADESASEGIRDLISRIEGAVSNKAAPGGGQDHPGEAPSDDEDLNRELEEIEALRSELNGLRNKISADG